MLIRRPFGILALSMAIFCCLLPLSQSAPAPEGDPQTDNSEIHQVVRREALHPQQLQQQGFTRLSAEQIRHLQNRGFGPTVPSSFRSTVAYEEQDEEEDDEDTSVASTQVRRPTYEDANSYLQNAIPVQSRPVSRPQQHQPQPVLVQRRPVQQQIVYKQQQVSEDKIKTKLEEEEKEEPDRLSLLLPNSRFDCTAKNTGYYADEELGCEVFHYCQDNAKHSWICPEGFNFHQVHLICMPPSGDNICEKSSQYHFVNEYLYKPLNLEEHQSRPNVSLKYSDRYYPDSYYGKNQYDDEEEADERQYQQQPRKQPIRTGLPQGSTQVFVRRPAQQFAPTIRPETTIGQVFRSPEEVNISLQQRRPQYATQRYQQEY